MCDGDTIPSEYGGSQVIATNALDIVDSNSKGTPNTKLKVGEPFAILAQPRTEGATLENPKWQQAGKFKWRNNPWIGPYEVKSRALGTPWTGGAFGSLTAGYQETPANTAELKGQFGSVTTSEICVAADVRAKDKVSSGHAKLAFEVSGIDCKTYSAETRRFKIVGPGADGAMKLYTTINFSHQVTGAADVSILQWSRVALKGQTDVLKSGIDLTGRDPTSATLELASWKGTAGVDPVIAFVAHLRFHLMVRAAANCYWASLGYLQCSWGGALLRDPVTGTYSFQQNWVKKDHPPETTAEKCETEDAVTLTWLQTSEGPTHR